MDVTESETDLIKACNLKPSNHGTSSVWKYFGFHHNDGVITDNTHVSCLLQSRNLSTLRDSFNIFFGIFNQENIIIIDILFFE